MTHNKEVVSASEIEKIRAAIAKCRQFKLMVELNLKLKVAESELRELMDADD